MRLLIVFLIICSILIIKSKNESDGMVHSVVAAILFLVFLLPYFINLIIFLVCLLGNFSCDLCESSSLLTLFGGIFVFIPVLFFVILDIIAIEKYKEYSDKNKKLRKALNIFNIISLVPCGIYFLWCLILIFFLGIRS